MAFLENLLTMMMTYTNRVGRLRIGDKQARYYLPHTANFVIRDFRKLQKGLREPELYAWIRGMPDRSVLFDVGASYGQEAVYAGVLGHKVVAFNADPQGSYYLAVNAKLNEGADITPVAALVADGAAVQDIEFASNRFYMKGRPKYWNIGLQIPSVSLNSYVRDQACHPTHLKIDVDGAETLVLKGASELLAGHDLKHIFIETDENTRDDCMEILLSAGFRLVDSIACPDGDIPAANLILERP